MFAHSGERGLTETSGEEPHATPMTRFGLLDVRGDAASNSDSAVHSDSLYATWNCAYCVFASYAQYDSRLLLTGLHSSRLSRNRNILNVVWLM